MSEQMSENKREQTSPDALKQRHFPLSKKKKKQPKTPKTKPKPQINMLDSMNLLDSMIFFLKTVYLTGGITFLDVTISATLSEVFCTAEKLHLEKQHFWSERCSL